MFKIKTYTKGSLICFKNTGNHIFLKHTVCQDVHRSSLLSGKKTTFVGSALKNEPRQANLCLRAFRNDKFQLRMPSHSEGLGIWLSV